MRGDRVRLGWRAALGTILAAVLLLHGFDRSFVLDGYSLSLLGMLLILALAGELESARLPGVDMRFRQYALSQIEREVSELPSSEPKPTALVPDLTEAEDSHERERAERSQAELRSLARDEPTAAVTAFFVDVERAVNSLYAPLQSKSDPEIGFTPRIQTLVERSVITPQEAGLLTELARLRNAYLHGSPVDHDEAVRVLAVGARLLPSLAVARRRIGPAFDNLVAEVLANIPGIAFEREATIKAEGPPFKADFLIVSPIRCVVEAYAATSSYTGVLRDKLRHVEFIRQVDALDAAAVVVPSGARRSLKRSSADADVPVLGVDELEDWLKRLLDARTRMDVNAVEF